MHTQKPSIEILDQNWNTEKKRSFFSVPYDFYGCLDCGYNALFGPSNRYANLSRPIPAQVTLNPITPFMTLGFVGDIMPHYNKQVIIEDSVKHFFGECDALIANFEGTIIDAPTSYIPWSLKHQGEILRILGDLFPPEKTILSLANNHSGDFGWERFSSSYKALQDAGFQVFGRLDEPALTINDTINLVTGTLWSNQPCDYVAHYEEVDQYIDPNMPINLLFPHWGTELHAYASPNQMIDALQKLQHWDLIIGHHSHVPQQVSAYMFNGIQKMVAYSLGDFICGYQMKKFHSGLLIKVEIGPMENGKWACGRVNYETVKMDTKNKGQLRISTQSIGSLASKFI